MANNILESKLGKTKEEIIYELLLSLNNGDSYYFNQRVEAAISQCNTLERQFARLEELRKEN